LFFSLDIATDQLLEAIWSDSGEDGEITKDEFLNFKEWIEKLVIFTGTNCNTDLISNLPRKFKIK